jgi:methionyl-tRNA formyltransferase
MEKKLRVLFIGKADDHNSKIAGEHIRLHFEEGTIVFSKRTEPFPGNLLEWEGDIIISYLSQWIIPGSLLEKAKSVAINFHPGPPEYPGIGCTNFAIYNKEHEFGITCHHMLAKVDTGGVIAVRRFPVWENDTVYSITQRCYTEILQLFYEMVDKISTRQELPVSRESWTRKPYTRKQLNELCELDPGMSREEMALRVKATTYGEKVWARMRVDEKKTQ